MADRGGQRPVRATSPGNTAGSSSCHQRLLRVADEPLAVTLLRDKALKDLGLSEMQPGLLTSVRKPPEPWPPTWISPCCLVLDSVPQLSSIHGVLLTHNWLGYGERTSPADRPRALAYRSMMTCSSE